MDKKLKEIYEKISTYFQINGISRFEEDVVKELKKSTISNNLIYQRDGLGSIN